MIKTYILKEDKKPVAVVLDYQEYIRLKNLEKDKNDYWEAVKIKKKNKKWIKHTDLKKELDL
jgi:Ethanolamine utilization protein EutJ (predicted chaperonin)